MKSAISEENNHRRRRRQRNRSEFLGASFSLSSLNLILLCDDISTQVSSDYILPGELRTEIIGLLALNLVFHSFTGGLRTHLESTLHIVVLPSSASVPVQKARSSFSSNFFKGLHEAQEIDSCFKIGKARREVFFYLSKREELVFADRINLESFKGSSCVNQRQEQIGGSVRKRSRQEADVHLCCREADVHCTYAVGKWEECQAKKEGMPRQEGERKRILEG
ncbi:hypothetical protein Leryth_025671 [Lithospermum erythrorhizon]|nr:hypothetical protein Leryth_025671 [Lithospermum erythrorhizon]